MVPNARNSTISITTASAHRDTQNVTNAVPYVQVLASLSCALIAVREGMIMELEQDTRCETALGRKRIRIDQIDGEVLIGALDEPDGLPVVEAVGVQYRCIAHASTLEHWRRSGESSAPMLVVDAVPYAVGQLEQRGPQGNVAVRLQAAEIAHAILTDRMRAYGDRFASGAESYIKAILIGARRGTHRDSNVVRYDDEAEIILRFAAALRKNAAAKSGLHALNNLIRLRDGLDTGVRMRLMDICSLHTGNGSGATSPLPPLTITAVERLATIISDRQGGILDEALASDNPTRYIMEAAGNTRRGRDAKRLIRPTCNDIPALIETATAALQQARKRLDDPSFDSTGRSNNRTIKRELTRIIGCLDRMAHPASNAGTPTTQQPMFAEILDGH